MTRFALRIHDRMTEDDPNLATVMYTSGDASGPWFDMATGLVDYAEEIVGALEWREDVLQAERDREQVRFQAERLADLSIPEPEVTPRWLRREDITYRLRHDAWSAPEGSDVSNLNAAADEIDRLRAEVADLKARVHALNENALKAQERIAELDRLNEFLARQVAAHG